MITDSDLLEYIVIVIFCLIIAFVSYKTGYKNGEGQ